MTANALVCSHGISRILLYVTDIFGMFCSHMHYKAGKDGHGRQHPAQERGEKGADAAKGAAGILYRGKKAHQAQLFAAARDKLYRREQALNAVSPRSALYFCRPPTAFQGCRSRAFRR